MLGFDLSAKAIDATLENLGTKHKPWLIKLGNATNLPLEPNSVDVLVTNPPWGIQMAVESDFYSGVVAEACRVLKTGGRLILIMRQGALQKKLFTSHGFQVDSLHKNITILGQQAEVFVCRK